MSELLKDRKLISMITTLLLTRPSLLTNLLLETLYPLPKEFEALAEKYKRGVAQAIGISPEDINEEVVKRWAIHWLRAMVKPEAWKKYGLI